MIFCVMLFSLSYTNDLENVEINIVEELSYGNCSDSGNSRSPIHDLGLQSSINNFENETYNLNDEEPEEI